MDNLTLDFDMESQIDNILGMEDLILDINFKSTQDLNGIEEDWLDKLLATEDYMNNNPKTNTLQSLIDSSSNCENNTTEINSYQIKTNSEFPAIQPIEKYETETVKTEKFVPFLIGNSAQEHCLRSPISFESMTKDLETIEILNTKTPKMHLPDSLNKHTGIEKKCFITEKSKRKKQSHTTNTKIKKKPSKKLFSNKKEVDLPKNAVINRSFNEEQPETLTSADKVKTKPSKKLKCKLNDSTFLRNNSNSTVTSPTVNVINKSKTLVKEEKNYFKTSDIIKSQKIIVSDDNYYSPSTFAKTTSLDNTNNSKTVFKANTKKRPRKTLVSSDVLNSLLKTEEKTKLPERQSKISTNKQQSLLKRNIKNDSRNSQQIFDNTHKLSYSIKSQNPQNETLGVVKHDKNKIISVETLKIPAIYNEIETKHLYDPNKIYNEVSDKRLLFSSQITQPNHLKFRESPNSKLCMMRRSKENAGYNPLRGDFEIEYDNNAEKMLCFASELSEYSGKGNAKSYSEDKKLIEELQLALAESYNFRLQERERIKRIIKQHGLINLKDSDMWYSRLENSIGKTLTKKLIRFSQLHSADEAEHLYNSMKILNEQRAEANKLIFYRNHRGITTKTEMKIYEDLGAARELGPDRVDVRNLMMSPTVKKKKAALEIYYMPGFRELSDKEVDLCSSNGLLPKFFLETKDQLVLDCNRNNGILLKRARKLVKIDVNKTRKIFDYLMEHGLIWQPAIDMTLVNLNNNSKRKRSGSSSSQD